MTPEEALARQQAVRRGVGGAPGAARPRRALRRDGQPDRADQPSATTRSTSSGRRTRGDGRRRSERAAQRRRWHSSDLDDWRDAIYAKIVAKVGTPPLLDRLGQGRRRHRRPARPPGSTRSSTTRAPASATSSTTSSPACAATSTTASAESDAIEMLAQHLITRPVFDALFAGYHFLEHNPVAQTMERMLDALDDAQPRRREPRRWTSSTPRSGCASRASTPPRAASGSSPSSTTPSSPPPSRRPSTSSASSTRRSRSSTSSSARPTTCCARSSVRASTDEGVHILDPFTGTGTFMVRLLQSRPDRAPRPGAQVRRGAARQRDPAARLLHRRGQHRDDLLRRHDLRRGPRRRQARRRAGTRVRRVPRPRPHRHLPVLGGRRHPGS